VFPNGEGWRDPNPKLYFDMNKILRAAPRHWRDNGISGFLEVAGMDKGERLPIAVVN
jgi:hypothetical protein